MRGCLDARCVGRQLFYFPPLPLIKEYVSNAPSNILITDWEVFLLMENSLLVVTIMATSRATLNLLWMGVMSWMVQALRMIPPEYAWIPRK